MRRYYFFEDSNPEFDKDPVFNGTFKRYINPSALEDPHYYIAGDYLYVLADPEKDQSDSKLLFKIATYLYHHPRKLNDKLVVYIFGTLLDSQNIAEKNFSGKIVKIVSYEMLDEWYPKNLEEINSKIVNFFIHKQDFYGQKFCLADYDNNYLFFISKDLKPNEQSDSYNYLKSQLFSNGYFKQMAAYSNRVEFWLTNYAFEKYQKNEFTETYTKRYGFIAIKFGGNEERIQAIQDAITECGYIPVIMNELEHNNWIMPEIFHQIKLSDFIVADLSLRCDGAYYEAGYALALGKEVIHTFDKREEKDDNRLHFDVAQKATVMYNDFNELKEKLVARIKATVNN